jgi:hypothetical protein
LKLSLGWRSKENWAGDIYVSGDLLLLALGGTGRHWNEIVASIGFLVGALLLSKNGHRPEWFAGLTASAIPCLILANLQALASGIPSIWLGTILFSLGQSFGGLSIPLSATFGVSPSHWIRNTLGRPRQTMGMVAILGKIPLLYGSAMGGRWGLLSVYALWILGDLLVACSSPIKNAEACP